MRLGPPKNAGGRAGRCVREHIFWGDFFVSFLVSKMKIGYRLISLMEERQKGESLLDDESKADKPNERTKG